MECKAEQKRKQEDGGTVRPAIPEASSPGGTGRPARPEATSPSGAERSARPDATSPAGSRSRSRSRSPDGLDAAQSCTYTPPGDAGEASLAEDAIMEPAQVDEAPLVVESVDFRQRQSKESSAQRVAQLLQRLPPKMNLSAEETAAHSSA